MELEDFKPGVFFYTGSGRWMVVTVEPNGKDSDGMPTPVVIAVPIEPNKCLQEKLDKIEPLLTEFYDYDFGGCDLEDRFTSP